MVELCGVGFKEWSVICAALAAGRQSLILRKGGIHEGSAGFQVAHRRFWLLPTHYHQAAQSVTDEGRAFLSSSDEPGIKPEAELRLTISHLATVEHVQFIEDEATLERLVGQHIWSTETVLQRFHYRQPGLFALVVRIYRAEPFDIGVGSHFAGCKSWVEFDSTFPTASVVPVLSTAEFAHAEQAVLAATHQL